MCKECDWKQFIRQAEDLLSEIEGIPEKGADFAASVRLKVEGMKDWAEENSHVTEKMETSLENIREGVAKWLR